MERQKAILKWGVGMLKEMYNVMRTGNCSIAFTWHHLSSTEMVKSVKSVNTSKKVFVSGSLELRHNTVMWLWVWQSRLEQVQRFNTSHKNYITHQCVLYFIWIFLLILNTVANCAPLDTIDVMPVRQTATIGPGILKWHTSKPIESQSGSSVTNWWNELVYA